jgi:hypothetical protein
MDRSDTLHRIAYGWLTEGPSAEGRANRCLDRALLARTRANIVMRSLSVPKTLFELMT